MSGDSGASQAFMLMELELPEGQQPAIPARLLSDARDAWRKVARDVRVSNLQRDVERVLRLMGEQPSLEFLTDDGYFSTDLAFPGAASCFPLKTDGRKEFYDVEAVSGAQHC